GLSPGQATAQCARQLRILGRALQSYQRDHRGLPDQLSDLYPNYIKDLALLCCPADPNAGRYGDEPWVQGTGWWRSLRPSCSYFYEGAPERRLDFMAQRRQFGGMAAIAGCRYHHVAAHGSPGDDLLYLRLDGTTAQAVWRGWWEGHPDSVAAMI